MLHRFNVFWQRCVGAGGEKAVYLARCVTTGQLCVVKVANCTNITLARGQLQIELDRCRRVAGSHVAHPIAWNLWSGTPFIAYELAAGTLQDEMDAILGQGLVYRADAALQRIEQILLAIWEVHGSGQIHRDLKPGNVLRFTGGALKLDDFGLGRTLARPCELQTQAFVGTPRYAAPEQVLHGCVDDRADLYAMGVILYEMLTGTHPGFRRPLVPPSQHRQGIFKALDRFVAWLLALDPDRRPWDANEALQEVARLRAMYALAAHLRRAA